VASDIPVHREAAALAAGGGVGFVDPHCSPLQLADAIEEAAGLSLPAGATLRIPSEQAAVDNLLAIYGSLAPTRMLAVAEER
jgi:hypothetical protein